VSADSWRRSLRSSVGDALDGTADVGPLLASDDVADEDVSHAVLGGESPEGDASGGVAVPYLYDLRLGELRPAVDLALGRGPVGDTVRHVLLPTSPSHVCRGETVSVPADLVCGVQSVRFPFGRWTVRPLAGHTMDELRLPVEPHTAVAAAEQRVRPQQTALAGVALQHLEQLFSSGRGRSFAGVVDLLGELACPLGGDLVDAVGHAQRACWGRE